MEGKRGTEVKRKKSEKEENDIERPNPPIPVHNHAISIIKMKLI